MTTNRSERLSGEQIALTSKYLEEITERYAAPLFAVQSLFGRCCLAMLASSGLSWDALANESSRLASGILNNADPSALSLDPLPIVEICLMMQEKSREAPEMCQILEKIRPELNAQSSDVRSIGRVRLIASSLARLGFSSPVARPSKKAAELLRDYESWLTAPAPLLADLADHLVADEVQLDEENTRLVSLIALGELRNYHIDVGCKLLRAGLQLGVPCDEIGDGVDFMALQRRRDGSYGFLDRLAEKPEQLANPDLTLFLPMTLNAVWLFKVEATCADCCPALTAAGGAE